MNNIKCPYCKYNFDKKESQKYVFEDDSIIKCPKCFEDIHIEVNIEYFTRKTYKTFSELLEEK